MALTMLEYSLESQAPFSVLTGVIGSGKTTLVRKLLQQLPPRQRQALEALKLKEMSLKEAAEVSGQSVGALKVNTHRAIKALRALLRETMQRR